MIELSQNLKIKIFESISTQENFLGVYGQYDGIIDFLNLIWKLKEMPSQDSRFNNAEDDAFQHLVANNDWDHEYLFLHRFDLTNDMEAFVRFVETVVSPTVRENRGRIAFFVSLINDQLSGTVYKLTLTDYLDGLPVYELRNKDVVKDLPEDIAPNTIPFYHTHSTVQRAHPHFSLSYDNWDDYGHKTSYTLYFVEGTYDQVKIGYLKLMARHEQNTKDVLPETFTMLPDEFCSLGQEIEYYERIKQRFDDRYQSVLLALRDVAFFPKILEQFEDDDIYKTSLIRFNDAEQLCRTVRLELNGYELGDWFKFSYVFRPPYTEESLQLNFHFDSGGPVEHRVYALIGKNGTGKTHILSNLAKELSKANYEGLYPRKPLYGKIFTVSYSVFDHFQVPTSDAAFNYVYCGLKKHDGTFLSETEILERTLTLANRIRAKKVEQQWFEILSNFISEDLLEEVFAGRPKLFQPHNFSAFYEKLSSGQNILVLIISEILAQIRLNSLILYDEPETHLHPNAITLLMNTIFDLVQQFESYCIIATHSPLIIQEIQARNIIIIDRDKDLAFVRQMEKESFGENLTVITEDIFGNRSIEKHHLQLIRKLVNKNETYEQIVALLSSENLPMNLNTKLYIKGLIAERNEKS